MPSRTSTDTYITHLHTTPRVHHNILNFIHCATAQIVLSLALLPLLVQFCVIANQKNRLAKITCQFFLFCTTARILSGCRNKTLHSKLYINIKLFPFLKIWCWKFLYITLNQKLLPENHEPWSQNNQILYILLKKLYRRHWYRTLIHLFLKCLSAKNQSIHPASPWLSHNCLKGSTKATEWISVNMYNTKLCTLQWSGRLQPPHGLHVKGEKVESLQFHNPFSHTDSDLQKYFFSSPRSPGVFCTDSPYRFHIYFSEFWSDLKKIVRLDGSFLHHRGHLKDDDVAIWFPVVSLWLCMSFS